MEAMSRRAAVGPTPQLQQIHLLKGRIRNSTPGLMKLPGWPGKLFLIKTLGNSLGSRV